MCQCAVQLPDGTEIQVGPDRFGVPEVLFQPVGNPKCSASRLLLADLGMKVALLIGVTVCDRVTDLPGTSALQASPADGQAALSLNTVLTQQGCQRDWALHLTHK